MRLIDADELGEILESEGFNYCAMVVWTAPTIEAEPIRHGKWRKVDYQICVGKGAFVDAMECSVCEEPNYEMSNYCPRCGARMDEVE